MKILINNYTNEFTTEPLYLDRCFNIAELTSFLWNENQISAFDVLDKYIPDVIIMHIFSKKLNDVLKYLQQKKSMSLIVNITGTDNKTIEELNKIIENNKIECPFYISNQDEIINKTKTKDKKIIKILPGADLFINKQQVPHFNVSTAIISSKEIDCIKNECKKHETYHTINIGKQGGYDLNCNIMTLMSLYDKYKEIILMDDVEHIFGQIFFDASLFGKKVTLKTDDRGLVNKHLAKLFSSDKESADISNFIKEQVKTKHTCYNRAEKLLQALKLESASKILMEINK